MSKEFEEIVLKKLENLELGLKDTNKIVKSLDKRIGNVEIEFKDTNEVVKYVNQNFTKFDYEINKKSIFYLIHILLVKKKMKFIQKILFL